jgi:histidine ammonia-lyase
VLANAQRVVAAELLCAAQGLDYRKPLRPARGVERLHARVRKVAAPLAADRVLSPDLEAVFTLTTSETLL